MILSRGYLRPTRLLLTITVLSTAYFLLYRLFPAIHYRSSQLYAHPTFNLTAHLPTISKDDAPSVNLVVASIAKEDTTWTSKLDGLIPNLRVLRYVSDLPTAEYRPAVLDTGREALMFFTYLDDFYDDLPDVSVFVHSHETPWHIDPALRQSMPFALAHLDLEQVQRRGYYNLRAAWQDACPAWINTTKTREEAHVHEEGYMADAFRANFGEDVPVPEILAGPCCSQFAVSKDTARRVPREQYKHHIDWLVKMKKVWGDQLTGRTWEHMWPYLFMEKAKDCPVERDSFCRMYHICFADHMKLREYQNLWIERESLKEALATTKAFFQLIAGSTIVAKAQHRITEIQLELDKRLEDALQRGRDATTREQTTLNLDW